jgi:hypothetical protein
MRAQKCRISLDGKVPLKIRPHSRLCTAYSKRRQMLLFLTIKGGSSSNECVKEKKKRKKKE